jgi:hypothetical protein
MRKETVNRTVLEVSELADSRIADRPHGAAAAASSGARGGSCGCDCGMTGGGDHAVASAHRPAAACAEIRFELV